MNNLFKEMRFYQLYNMDRIKKLFGAPLYYNDLLYMAAKSMAFRFSGETDPFLQYMFMLNVLRQDKSMKKGLELGGGYSTLILSKLIIDNECQITSIDINPFKYKAIIPSARHRRYLFSLIDIVEDLTIDYESLVDFYKNQLPKEIAKYDPDIFKKTLANYVNNYEGDGMYTDKGVDPIGYLYPNGDFDINGTLLAEDVLSAEKDFYQQFDRVKKNGVIDKALKDNTIYDFIFFDCGELSSLVEWFLLKDTIRKGGYAFFHDIYFPKSIKNFIAVSFVELSDEWEVVFCDKSTPQGMLVARKL
ncbi:MAG: hypothetical protein ACI9YE_002830 [Psychroserpens sp.]|jgi:hypothetical protein